MFGICAFLFIVTSLSFRYSSAKLIDSSFFNVVTAFLTKQSSVNSLAFSKYPFFFRRFNSFATCSCNYLGIGLLFCCIT